MMMFLLLSSLFILVYTQSDDLGECYSGELASWHLKKWALADPILFETFDIKFYDAHLTLVRDGDGPSWYLVGEGWQGMFYYESGEPGESRAGAYLFPDYSTAIVGLWMDHILLQGKATRLGEACRSGQTWILKFGDLNGPVLSYSPPSHYSLGGEALQQDPFEVATVEVRESGIEGAKDGLFALRDIIAGEVLTFYSGYIINCDSSLRALDRRDLNDEEEHVRNMYNMAIDLEDGENLCIDLPPELGNDVKRYNATLGHKVNHSFEPNAEFVLFPVHPVLGTIMSLAALTDIHPAEEITVNYGYNYTTDPDQPEWFILQWNSFYDPNNNNSDNNNKNNNINDNNSNNDNNENVDLVTESNTMNQHEEL